MAFKSIDTLTELQNGETIECSECKSGHYIPFGNVYDLKRCYHFKCNNCDNMIIATKKLNFDI